MEEKPKKIIAYSLDIALIILIILAFVRYNKTKDKGVYDFCTEWNYNIYREDLLWKCYDYRNQRQLCDWRIDTNNKLIVYDVNNSSDYDIYDCTKLVKTINIEIIPKIEELRI